MKHDPKIHTQIHPAGTFPVHEGVYRVEYFGRWRWCKWSGGEWKTAWETFDFAEGDSVKGDQHKPWFGLRKKPKGMK